MLRKHRVFLAYLVLAAVLGGGLGAAWFLTTGRGDMPAPAVATLGVASALIADATERIVRYRQRRRQRSGPARHRKTPVTPGPDTYNPSEGAA